MTGAPHSWMPAIAAAIAGFLFGLLYFTAVQRTASLLGARRGWFAPLALTLGRIAAAALFLTIVAKLGAALLLSAFVGFLFARILSFRYAGKPS